MASVKWALEWPLLLSMCFAVALPWPSGMQDIDGQSYPLYLTNGGGQEQALVGGGTRFKFKYVKVYALALYLDNTAAAAALAPFQSASGENKEASAALVQNEAFQAIIEGGFPTTLALVFHRGVTAAAVTGALKDSLATRVDATAVSRFEEALNGALSQGIPAGYRLFLACADATLTISVGSVESAAATVEGAEVLCPALLDVYLGASPISPAIKDGVAVGFKRVSLLPVGADARDCASEGGTPEEAGSEPQTGDEPPEVQVD